MYATATTAGEPADNCENSDREADGDGEDDGGESVCQRPHRRQPTAVKVRPAPIFPLLVVTHPSGPPAAKATASTTRCAAPICPYLLHRLVQPHQRRRHEVGGGSVQGPASLRYAPACLPLFASLTLRVSLSSIPLPTSLFALGANAPPRMQRVLALLYRSANLRRRRGPRPLRACAPLECAVASAPHPAPVPVSACRTTMPPTLMPAPAFWLVDEQLWYAMSPRGFTDSLITAFTSCWLPSHSKENARDPFHGE